MKDRSRKALDGGHLSALLITLHTHTHTHTHTHISTPTHRLRWGSGLLTFGSELEIARILCNGERKSLLFGMLAHTHALPQYLTTRFPSPICPRHSLPSTLLHVPPQVWAKVDLVRTILRTGYHVHFSDVDVVYLRKVWPSYRLAFHTSGPDAVFMEEQWQLPPGKGYVNLFNTGVYAMRSNPRSLAFMDLW
jgi:hypothetical protein